MPISVKGGIDNAEAACSLIHQLRLSTLQTATTTTSRSRVVI
jgi:hypothetical protein